MLLEIRHFSSNALSVLYNTAMRLPGTSIAVLASKRDEKAEDEKAEDEKAEDEKDVPIIIVSADSSDVPPSDVPPSDVPPPSPGGSSGSQ